MKKTFVKIVGLAVLLTVSVSVNAQVLGVYEKQHTQSRKPVPYQFLREADVMWSKTIWRKLPLREKINHSLYFPTVPLDDRMSLIDLLLWGIDNQGLQAFNPDNQFNEFANPMTREEINMKFDAQDKVIQVEDPVTLQMVDKVIPGAINSFDVKEYLMKELWFFDKQRSVMDVRIIGICPIREFYKDPANTDDASYKKMFWMYFPEIRTILANHEVFNPKNDAERRSFDDFFIKRYFSSLVVQESNAYDNRLIAEYTLGIESLLESESIKERIFNYEHDLWEY